MDTINVVLYADGNTIIAQGLELDVVVQGETVLEAKQKFYNYIIVTIDDVRTTATGIPAQAPLKFFPLLLESKPTCKIPIPNIISNRPEAEPQITHNVIPLNVVFWYHISIQLYGEQGHLDGTDRVLAEGYFD